MNKAISISAIVISVFALGVAYFAPTSTETVREVVREKLGATPGGDFYNPVFFHDRVVMSRPAIATTTTGTAATLTENDLLNAGYYSVTLGGPQDTSFTYTLPASTTLQRFVPKVGNKEEVCFFQTASSTSAGTDLIFAAGTGIDLVHSTTTAPVPLGVGEDQTACITFIRQGVGTSATIPGDITAVLELYSHSD